MNGTFSGTDPRKLRLLVGIASFGEKNLGFLKTIIKSYQELPYKVDVVVFSNAPKNLGDTVKVVVGLPTPNPWSLPFAHKPYFKDHLDAYDLFIYSEDDMEVTGKNIQAFLDASDSLAPDEIAGYLRFETDPAGVKVLTDAHGPYHWKPESVARRGKYVVAEYTNEHAAFYILTQPQLRQAIASGGFMRPPHQERYDLLVTAATDPYTVCGFRKVVCVSVLDDFLIRHMSNLYVNRQGITLAGFKQQVETLIAICDRGHPVTTLCTAESKLADNVWSKSFYEHVEPELMQLVPETVRTVLSIGCGAGELEGALMKQGRSVTALPLDSVIGTHAAQLGVEMIYGRLDESLIRLGNRKFDCVVMTNLLYLQADPGKTLKQLASLVGKDGSILLSGPNFARLPWAFKRIAGRGEFKKLQNFASSGINRYGPGNIASQLKKEGLTVSDIRWLHHKVLKKKMNGFQPSWGRLTARSWVLAARRSA